MSDDPSAIDAYYEEAPRQGSVQDDSSPRRIPESENPGLQARTTQTPATPCAWATLEGLYQRHADNLRGYLRKLIGAGPPDPDDVVQAAFEKMSKVGDFNQIKNPHAFLWRTAQNVVTSEHRSSSVRERHVGNVTDVFYAETGDRLDPERVLLAEKELSLAVKAISAMPESRRCVLLMNRIDGMSVSQIGDKLGISGSAVRKRLVLAMAEVHRATGND